MRIYREKRRVPHEADKMFALVADMERYSDFLPFCESNVVLTRRMEADREIVVSKMTVAFKVLRESFRSRVTLEVPKRRILIESKDGPLREFRTRWTFLPVDAQSCEVEILVTYELASPLLSTLLGSVIESAIGRLGAAFQQRADTLYGKRTSRSPRVGESVPITP